MVRAAPIQAAFNAGEFSPLMEGHITLEKRADAGLLVQNLIALKQGPLVRRGGTRFVKEVKSSASRTHLIPFEFSTEQAYMIEAGDQYFRFYRNNGIITETAQDISGITKANPAVVTYVGADNYANGNEIYISSVAGMTQVNGKFYKVANVNTGTNTFEIQDVDGNNIDSTAYSTYTSGGTIAEVYQIASPYTQANLFDSTNLFKPQYAQSADVLYITHPSYAPRALTRTAHTSWVLTTLTLNDGPYLVQNTTSTTLTPSGGSYAPGNTPTVTASSVTGINAGLGFLATDVGRVIRVYTGTAWAWGTIATRTSTTEITVLVKGTVSFPSTAQTKWRLGAYSDTTGWPSVVTFFQDRLVVGGSTDYPDRLDFTRTGGYSDTELLFSPDTDGDGTVTDDAWITITLQSGQVNAIKWMAANTKGLLVGTTSREWVVRPSETNDVLTPSNAKADPSDDKGGSLIKPITTDGGAIFSNASRRRLYFMGYDFEQDRIKADDLNLFADHITRTQVLGMAYQQEPVNVVWAYRADGTLIGMTFYPDQSVIGWHRHIIGGVSDALGTQAKVESVAVIPSADGSREELWLIVQRYIDGITRRYVEYMTRYYEDDMDQEDAFHVDSGLTYEGSATGTITGLDHLEGETVKVNVNGRSHPDRTVTNGSITLANSRTGTVMQIGLSNRWAFKSVQIEAGSKDGTAQGKTKRITGFAVRLLNTLGLMYGPDEDNLDEYDFDQGGSYDEATPLFTGDTEFLSWPGDYDTAGQIYMTDAGVFPACIQALMPQLTTYDRG